MGADARVPPILLKCGGSSGGIRAHNNEGWSQELVEEEENRSASLKSKIKILVRVNFFIPSMKYRKRYRSNGFTKSTEGSHLIQLISMGRRRMHRGSTHSYTAKGFVIPAT